MKNLVTIVLLVCFCLVGYASVAQAAKPTEAVLFHCGCEAFDEYTADATSDLVWKEIIVNSNSKGHRKHMALDEENCTYIDEFEVTQDNYLTRGYDDFQDEDNDPLLVGVGTCEYGVDCPTAGDSCVYVVPE